jgi:hypothetical protein
VKPVDVKYVTKFDGAPPKLIVIPCKQRFELELPEFKDVFKKKATLDFESIETNDFLKFESTQRKFMTFGDNSKLCDYEGKYKGQLFITDSAEQTLTYNIEIDVTKEEEKSSLATDAGSFTPQIKLPPPVPRI